MWMFKIANLSCFGRWKRNSGGGVWSWRHWRMQRLARRGEDRLRWCISYQRPHSRMQLQGMWTVCISAFTCFHTQQDTQNLPSSSRSQILSSDSSEKSGTLFTHFIHDNGKMMTHGDPINPSLPYLTILIHHYLRFAWNLRRRVLVTGFWNEPRRLKSTLLWRQEICTISLLSLWERWISIGELSLTAEWARKSS